MNLNLYINLLRMILKLFINIFISISIFHLICYLIHRIFFYNIIQQYPKIKQTFFKKFINLRFYSENNIYVDYLTSPFITSITFAFYYIIEKNKSENSTINQKLNQSLKFITNPKITLQDIFNFTMFNIFKNMLNTILIQIAFPTWYTKKIHNLLFFTLFFIWIKFGILFIVSFIVFFIANKFFKKYLDIYKKVIYENFDFQNTNFKLKIQKIKQNIDFYNIQKSKNINFNIVITFLLHYIISLLIILISKIILTKTLLSESIISNLIYNLSLLLQYIILKIKFYLLLNFDIKTIFCTFL